MKRYLPLLLIALLAPLPVNAWETILSDVRSSGHAPGRGLMKEGLVMKELGSSTVLPKLTNLPPLIVDWKGMKAVLTSEDGYFIFVDKNGMISKHRACNSGEVVSPTYGIVQGGKKALVYACWNPDSGSLNVKIMTTDGRVASVSGVGIIKSFPDYMSERAPPPLIVDFDNDGVNEIFWVDNSRLWWKDDPYSMESEYYIFSSTGKVKGLSAGDVDGDGYLEVLMGTVNGILVKNHDRDIVDEYSSEPCYGPPVVGDLNGDGKDDVVAYSKTYIAGIIDGNKVWGLVGNFGVPAVADVNGDGKDDVIFVENRRYLVAVSGTGGTLWKFDPKLTGEMSMAQPVMADLDSDGLPEAVVVFGSYLMIVNDDGTLLRKFFLKDIPVTRPSVGDLDGDGILEIVMGVKDFVGSYMVNHKVIMFDEPEGSVDNPPSVNVISPKNQSTVGPSVELKFSVNDDRARKLEVTVYALYSDWTTIYSEEVDSGGVVELKADSSQSFRIEVSDGVQVTTVMIGLHLMNKPPGLIITPKNMSTIPAQNAIITVQPTYHTTGELCWVSMDYRARNDVPWSNVVSERSYLCGTQIKFNVTNVVFKTRGYVQFRISARDRYHNNVSKVMVYRVVGKPIEHNSSEAMPLRVELKVDEGPHSKYVPIEVLGSFDVAHLYYRALGEQDWIEVGEVQGEYQWDVSSLEDGEYELMVEASSGNRSITDTARVVVDNTPPQANLTVEPEKVQLGSKVRAEVHANEEVTVIWDTDGDGTFDSPGPKKAYFKPKKTGEFIISVKVVDKAGNYVIRRRKVVVVPSKVETVVPSKLPVTPPKRQTLFDVPAWALAIPIALLVSLIVVFKRRGGRRKEIRRVNPWISK